MNIYTVPVQCGLCGGKGVARAGSYSWSEYFHKDPFVCKEVLRSKAAKEKAEREKAVGATP